MLILALIKFMHIVAEGKRSYPKDCAVEEVIAAARPLLRYLELPEAAQPGRR